MLKKYILDLKNEFRGYNASMFMKDALAGITVAAVALPLALAFGLASGADAAAGLITAIIAGLVIGILSGASYQISGPTGAMSAILISLSITYGLQGVFLASFISGIILLIAAIFKFGKLVSFIPQSVITGFTSGIAIIIALGQIDNFFGTVSQGTNAIEKLSSYFTLGFNIDYHTLFFGALVVLIMILWPKSWQKVFPSSLAGIIIALIAHLLLPFEVAEVGAIPTTLFPENRLNLLNIDFSLISKLIVPAISISALGMIESLLCGASAGKMKNEKLDADRELLAQGVGNMLIPLFGGVPATAAIARTSVAIKSGGQTRLVSVIHSLVLIVAMFLLGNIMSRIPMSALAGVLMMTAFRMNEFEEIGFMFKNKIKSSITQFLVTMIATVLFDLTTAILLGIIVSMFLFVMKNTSLNIESSKIDRDRVDDLAYDHHDSSVIYVSGPVFFGNQGQITNEINKHLNDKHIILSMRGVPSIDDSGVKEIEEVLNLCHEKGIELYFAGLQNNVYHFMDRCNLIKKIGHEFIHWDTIKALKVIDDKC